MAASTGPVGWRGRRSRRASGSGDRPTLSTPLNLVLCGSDAALKASVSKCFRGEKTLSTSHQTEFRSMSVIEAEMVDGRLISLVELPALNQLSEEELKDETLRCVSLCDPGVHVFIIIVPAGPLNNEETAEIEKIQRIFDSKKHFMVLFTTRLNVNRPVINVIKSSTDSQRLISIFGGRYRVIGLNEPENSQQIPELLDYIENMKTEPYSPQMCVKAQEKRIRHELEEKYKEGLKKIENNIGEFQLGGAEREADYLKCLRIVLVGRTGNGKSASGNTILGRKEFVSEASMCSVTTVCQKRVGEVDGRSVAVIDTPGLFDTTLTNEQVVEEIMKCVSLSSPGPHVFVIVLRVGRFTKEEKDTVDLIKNIFGPKTAQFSIVLFTRGDELQGESIEDYMKRGNNAELNKLIRDCENRFLAFNNRENQDKTQVIQLLNMIEELKNTNEGRYFTNSMFEEAEMSIKKRMEEIMKEREREIQTQKEELQTKYEREMKDMMKRLEEEKQRAEEERIKMENQIRTERNAREQEREQHKREREIAEKMVEDLQRDKTECNLIKTKHEEEIKRIKMKYEDEARKQAEESNDFGERKEQWNLDIKDKLEEQDDQHESLEDQYEDSQKGEEEEELIKRNKRKSKRCVII